MNGFSRWLLLIFVALAAQQIMTPQALGQGRGAARGFGGEWEYVLYPTSRDELPPFYKDAPLKDVPRVSLSLTIRQKGDRLSGEYGATDRYLAKIEDGDFNAIVRRGEARLNLASGFGGHVVALISLRGDKLSWKLLKSEGENYFPDDITLHRVRKRRRR